MGGENSAEQGEGKEEAIEGFGFNDALDFGAEPEEEGGPENEHDERSAGAGEVEERGGEHGEDGGEEGDVGFEPAVEEEDEEDAEEETDDDAREFDGVRSETEEGEGEFLEGVVGEVDDLTI